MLKAITLITSTKSSNLSGFLREAFFSFYRKPQPNIYYKTSAKSIKGYVYLGNKARYKPDVLTPSAIEEYKINVANIYE